MNVDVGDAGRNERNLAQCTGHSHNPKIAEAHNAGTSAPTEVSAIRS